MGAANAEINTAFFIPEINESLNFNETLINYKLLIEHIGSKIRLVPRHLVKNHNII